MSIAVAVDLPWGERATRRTAWAAVDDTGAIHDLRSGASWPELLAFLSGIDAGALYAVFLDIPIEGYEWLRERGLAFRPVDRSLQTAGIPLYPSRQPADRGARLAAQIRDVMGDGALPILEVYPYSVLRMARALLEMGKGLPEPDSEVLAYLLDEGLPRSAPLPYKKGPKPQRSLALAELRNIFLAKTPLFFADSLPSPDEGQTIAALDELADLYDACLATLLGLYLMRKSPYACLAGDAETGQLLLIADGWLQGHLQKTGIPIWNPSKGDPPWR